MTAAERPRPRPLTAAIRQEACDAGEQSTGSCGGSALPLEPLRLYTPEQAAALLGDDDITGSSLRAAAHRREIPFHMWRGKVRFTVGDLRAAVDQTAVPATPGTPQPAAGTRAPTPRRPPRRATTATGHHTATPAGSTGSGERLVARSPQKSNADGYG